MSDDVLYKDRIKKEDIEDEGRNDPNGKAPVKKKKNFLVIYATTLLAVSFIIVLLSYLNEIRVNRSEIADLKQEKETFSMSAMQDISDLQQKNEELTEKTGMLSDENELLLNRITELEERNGELEDKLEEFRKEADRTAKEREKLETREEAIDAMLKISELYTNKKYSYSAYEISVLENGNTQYISSLFDSSDNGEMIGKLVSQYTGIRAWLDKKGYMDPEKIEEWRSRNIPEKAD